MADITNDAPIDAEIIAAEAAPARENGAAPMPPATGRQPGRRQWLSRVPDSAWKAATLFSFVVNAALVVVLIVAVLMLFQIKRAIAQPLVGGLHSSFEAMDAAHIVTTIQVDDTIQVNDTIHVNDTIPVVFDLPLSTNTTVVLTNDTLVPKTLVYLNGIAVPTDIVLPAGTPLNIALNLVVPVSKTVPVVLEVPVALQVPVHLNVPVDIPLKQTELHAPFNNLVNLVGPYSSLLDKLPSSWGDLLRPR